MHLSEVSWHLLTDREPLSERLFLLEQWGLVAPHRVDP